MIPREFRQYHSLQACLHVSDKTNDRGIIFFYLFGRKLISCVPKTYKKKGQQNGNRRKKAH